MPACSAGCAAFSRTTTAVPRELPLLRRAVVEYAVGAGVPAPTLRDLALAVSEMLTNVIVHAYPDGRPPGPMTVSARVDGDELHVTVSDAGVGLPEGATPRFGLGLTIATDAADDLQLARADGGGTEVRLTFPAQG